MTLPLTKTLDPADLDALTEELAIVDRHFIREREQHPLRRWEYALALRALDTWLETRRERGTAGVVVDVGGAGSPFHYMVGDSAIVVDPDEGDHHTLAQYLEQAPRLSQAVFCISVLEHVDDLDQFLYHLACLTAPGGLLFLTMDCRENHGNRDEWPIDDRHFHWMRKRIFTTDLIQDGVETPLLFLGFSRLGAADWTYHGHHLYDGFTFASLALVKRN